MKSDHGIGKIIASARKRLGLSEQFCASHSGLSIEEYCDVESNDEEFFGNITIGTARRICKILDLQFVQLAIRFLGISTTELSAVDDIHFFYRHDLISTTRRRKLITEAELATMIGFDVEVIAFLERTPDFIESLPIRVVVDAAKALDIDPGLLICNRL